MAPVTGYDNYSNQMFITTTCGTRTRFKDDDEIKQASVSYLESMHLDDLDARKSLTHVQFRVNVGFSVRYSASFYFFY